MDKLHKLFNKLLSDECSLIDMTLHSPIQKSSKFTKVHIRPILIKNEQKYQITYFDERQCKNSNVLKSELLPILLDLAQTFKQIIIRSSKADYHILINKSRSATILEKKPTKMTPQLDHNRKKNYLLEEGKPIPFLIELGIMNNEGKVYPKKYDKFKQVNRFLEFIEDVLPELDHSQRIRIVDFGCGKSYLTFALYHYLTAIHRLALQVDGLDLKQDVIDDCNTLAKKLNFSDLNFYVSDINHYNPSQKVDMVIVLHACDTATDAALEKAVRWNATVILAAPCCQHELYHQMKSTALDPMLKQGIIKERFAALATDALRAKILEILGYKTQIIEFIDLEHTPKNLLIRSVRLKENPSKQKYLHEYLQLKELLNVNPNLEVRFKSELARVSE